jgi:two-component system response regulator ResD
VSTVPSNSGRVLVVEDEPMVAEVVERYLRRDGFEVRAASDGVAALRLFREWVPDLVILDIMLPGIDGLEVCRRVRAISEVPIIMLTARGDEPDRLVGLGLGADDYVTKPFSPRLGLRVPCGPLHCDRPRAPASR